MRITITGFGACLSALIRKMHEAKVFGVQEAALWKTGISPRAFLYSEDTADLGFMAKSRAADALFGMNL